MLNSYIYTFLHICMRKKSHCMRKGSYCQSSKQAFYQSLMHTSPPLFRASPAPPDRTVWGLCSRTIEPLHNRDNIHHRGRGGPYTRSFTNALHNILLFNNLYLIAKLYLYSFFSCVYKVKIRVHSYRIAVCNCKSKSYRRTFFALFRTKVLMYKFLNSMHFFSHFSHF